MRLKKLRIEDWKQFDTVDIDFHPRLTILTGVNGSGKTTLLKLIHGHYESLGTPTLVDETHTYYLSRERDKLTAKNGFDLKIGEIEFTGGMPLDIKIQPSKFHQVIYGDKYPPTQKIIYLPSHRRPFSYVETSSQPSSSIHKHTSADRVQISMIRNARADSTSPNSSDIRQAITSWILYGFGNERQVPVSQSKDFFEEFEEILRIVLPESLGFKKLYLHNGIDLVVSTKNGEFLFDVFSGGLSTIVELAWILFGYLQSRNSEAIVLIDEAEAHLHAEMQRSLLPKFMTAFTNAQFIICIHSGVLS